MLKRLLPLAAVTLLLVGLAGCGTRYQLHHDEMTSPPAWPFERGTASAQGAVDQTAFPDSLAVLWETGVGGKLVGPMTIYHNTLVVPESRKRIRFYDCETGKYLGRIKAQGVPQTSVVIADSLAFYATGPAKNNLRAHDLIRRKLIWDRELSDVLPGPILLDDRLLAGSADGTMCAFRTADGQRLWTFDSEFRFSASPSFGSGRLFQPAEHGWLFALDPDSGQELYRVQLKGPAVSVVAVDERVYATDVLGNVYALHPDDGRVVWETKLDGQIWTSPAVAHGRLFVADASGDLTALQALDGHLVWRHETHEVFKASPLVVGPYVIAGTMRGTVILLRADDGTLVDSATLEGGIAFGPVTDGDRVFVATERGKLVCFGEKHESRISADQGVNAQY